MFKGSRIATVNWIVSLLILIGLILMLIDSTSLEAIEVFAKARPITAILFLLALFVLVSLVPFVPSIPFYALSGRILSGRILAFVVSFLGVVLLHAISYLIGYIARRHKASRLSVFNRYRKAKETLYVAVARTVSNEGFRSLFLVALSPFPQKTLGKICGHAEIPFGIFLVASLIGSFPALVSVTMLGKGLNDPTSPLFYFSVILTVTVTVFSALIFHKTNLK